MNKSRDKTPLHVILAGAGLPAACLLGGPTHHGELVAQRLVAEGDPNVRNVALTDVVPGCSLSLVVLTQPVFFYLGERGLSLSLVPGEFSSYS